MKFDEENFDPMSCTFPELRAAIAACKKNTERLSFLQGIALVRASAEETQAAIDRMPHTRPYDLTRAMYTGVMHAKIVAQAASTQHQINQNQQGDSK